MKLLSSLVRRPFLRARSSSFAVQWPVRKRDKEERRVLTRFDKHHFRIPGSHSSSLFSTSTQSLSRRRPEKRPFTPSPEQQKIVKLCVEHNVVVSARPGSGKTATAEAIVAAYPNSRICVITYSRSLAQETQGRLDEYPNGMAFTLHKMAGFYLDIIVRDDAVLSRQLKNAKLHNKLPKGNFEPFDIIILDEVQDCTYLHYQSVICFLRINQEKMGEKPVRIIILGDERQCIYRFRGADHRYLTLAPELLGAISPSPFAHLPMTQSHRLSNQTVQFINKGFLGGEPCITSSKPGPKPVVLRCNPFGGYKLAQMLMPMIKRYGAKNTAIIAPAIRNNRPLQNLANMLGEKYRIPIHVPIDDHGPLDEKVIAGKLCISTIHQFKGRERDLVILLGMDSSFFEYLGRNLPDDNCPNEVFVALTRAKEQLVLVHNDSKQLMPFVSVDALYETAEIRNMTRKKAMISSPDQSGRPSELGLILPSMIMVSDMARHARSEGLAEIIESHLCIQYISTPLPEAEHINMKDIVCTDRKRGLYEAVGDINGFVVGAAFEQALTGTVKILQSEHSFDINLSVCSEENIAWLCRQACYFQTLNSGYKSRALQMRYHRFNWIKPEQLNAAQGRLLEELGVSTSSLNFEVDIEQEFIIDDQKTRLRGRADVVTFSSSSNNSETPIASVWEIKFVSQLTDEHIVQASTYAYLLASKFGQLPRIILYNVRDGQKLEITPRHGLEGLRRMIESVLRLKYTATSEMEDEAFMDMCSKATQEILNLDGDGAEEG